MKKIILIPVCVLFVWNVFAQNAIEYKPKALLNALQKAGITDVSAIKEIALEDSTVLQPTTAGKYFQFESNNTSPFQYLYVGRVNSCRAGGCSIVPDLAYTGNSEYFDYYIIFDRFKTVRAVKVFNYQATHGQEITAKGWLKQFVGHNGSEPLQVNKNIDAISGATISVYAITFDVMMKTEILRKYL